MTAVLGLDRETLQKACDGARALGVVEICNDNCPGQLVISGARAAVEQAGVLAKELGAKRCMPLKVSGPFTHPSWPVQATCCRNTLKPLCSIRWNVPFISTVWADERRKGANQ